MDREGAARVGDLSVEGVELGFLLLLYNGSAIRAIGSEVDGQK